MIFPEWESLFSVAGSQSSDSLNSFPFQLGEGHTLVWGSPC
jgi:hypothetical protein